MRCVFNSDFSKIQFVSKKCAPTSLTPNRSETCARLRYTIDGYCDRRTGRHHTQGAHYPPGRTELGVTAQGSLSGARTYPVASTPSEYAKTVRTVRVAKLADSSIPYVALQRAKIMLSLSLQVHSCCYPFDFYGAYKGLQYVTPFDRQSGPCSSGMHSAPGVGK